MSSEYTDSVEVTLEKVLDDYTLLYHEPSIPSYENICLGLGLDAPHSELIIMVGGSGT